MIQVFPADSRYSVDLGWVKGYRSFSFGEPFDPDNTSFGVMRVCNDDRLAPGRGFGPHPHSDMEIVTIVLSGQIKHEDNLGNAEVTSFGEVQRMTAGSGIIHAEYNASETEELSVLQLWFLPWQRGLTPSYETSRYDTDGLINALLPVVSHKGMEHIAKIHQEMTLYLSRLEKGRELSFQQKEGRRVFLFVIDGRLSVNGTAMGTRDTARMQALPSLTITADEAAFFMLIDLP